VKKVVIVADVSSMHTACVKKKRVMCVGTGNSEGNYEL